MFLNGAPVSVQIDSNVLNVPFLFKLAPKFYLK